VYASGAKKAPLVVRAGSQSSIGDSSAPVKSSGATPTIVKVRSSATISRPSTERSPPNWRCHRP
jgi:hypothetical protein